MARGVCTNWCDLVDETLSFSVELTDHTLSIVQSMNRPIRNLVVTGLTVPISFEESIRGWVGTEVDHLCLGQNVINPLQDQVSQDNTVALLTSLKEVKRLTVAPRCLLMKDLAVFQMISLPNVTKLEIHVRRLHEIDAFCALLHLDLPALMDLIFDWDKVYINNTNKMIPLYQDMYGFVAQHSASLKRLHLVMPFHWIVSRTRRRSRRGPSRNEPSFLHQLEQVQLDEVILKDLPVEGLPEFNLGFHLLNSQHRLRKVCIHDVKVCLYPKLTPLFTNCSGSLTDVVIDGASMGANSYGPFSCSLFHQCSKLRTLIIHNAQITQLTHIESLPPALQVLSLKMPINGGQVYRWISQNLRCLRDLTLRPTLWDSNAVVDMSHFRRFLALPHLVKLTLSDGLFESKEIMEFTRTTPGLNLRAASYCWPDLVSVHVDIDRSVFRDDF